MKLIISTPARDELREAAHRYEAVSIERRRHFMRAVMSAFRLIRDQPTLFATYEGMPKPSKFRRSFVNGYPYVIIYDVEDEQVSIVAIAHGSRMPGYWERR
jgi:toxin ParE1/3/4